MRTMAKRSKTTASTREFNVTLPVVVSTKRGPTRRAVRTVQALEQNAPPAAPPVDDGQPPPPRLPPDVIIPDTRVYHAVAICRWCKAIGRAGRFRQISTTHLPLAWICEHEACEALQMAHAIKNTSGEIVHIPLPLTVDVKLHPAPHLLLAGAAGVSKSFGVRWLLYESARAVVGFRALLMRATYPEFDRNHGLLMESEGLALGDMSYNGATQGPMARTATFSSDGRIIGGSCENEAQLSRHLGVDWDFVVMDEGVTYRPKVINEVLPRCRGSVTGKFNTINAGRHFRTIVPTNPGGRAMRYLVEFYITKDPDIDDYPQYKPQHFAAIYGTLEDNPYLEEDYESKNLSMLSAARYKQLRHGDWSVIAGQFFDKFSALTHVRTVPLAEVVVEP